MPSGWRTAFAGIVLAGLAGLLLAAMVDRRDLAFTLGVPPVQVAAVVPPGHTACQAPIDVPADGDRVQFRVGTFGRPGPALMVGVRDVTSGARVATAGVRGGFQDNSDVTASAGVQEGSRVAVCVRNSGAGRVALYGGTEMAARTSELRVDGRRTGTDMTLRFERGEARSTASLVPEILERAALFKAGWASSALLWALAGIVLAGVPALLALAISQARDARDLSE